MLLLLVYVTFYATFYWRLLAEDEFVDSLSTATPRESTEIDDEQEKPLLSSSDGTEDIIFVKEAQVK